MPDRDCRVALAAREFWAGDAFNLRLHEELTIRSCQPSTALAVIQELVEQYLRMEAVPMDAWFQWCTQHRTHFLDWRGSRFPNRPAERTPAKFPRDGKGEVRPASPQLPRSQEFKENREQMLRDVVSRQGREVGGDLAGRAVNGRNEDQQHDVLPDAPGLWVEVTVDEFQKNLVGRRITTLLFMAV
jgi:hypothetical protein